MLHHSQPMQPLASINAATKLVAKDGPATGFVPQSNAWHLR
jgi:hypothetical protein